jgi:lipopolysaccharide export system permease protein
MSILDRMLFWTVVRAYLICLLSTLSLYIIVDLFTNLDDFTGKADGIRDSLQRIGLYYGYRTIQYFDRLAEVLALLAAMFTVAWLQKNNELLPMLSCGVSTRRVLRPILFAASGFIALGSFVQEFVIPLPVVANALQADRDDVFRSKDVLVQGAYEPNGTHIEGIVGNPRDQIVRYFYVTIPETPSNSLMHIAAGQAQYLPPGASPLSGGWLLTQAQPPEPGEKNKPVMLQFLEPGKYFLKTKEVDFQIVTRRSRWADYLSTGRIYELLQGSDGRKNAGLAVTFHMRLTRPLVGILLVVMGLSIILRDQTRHVLISSGLCLIVCGLFYGAIFAGRFLGMADYVSPPLAAWLPVILFGPVAVSLFDSVHT